MQCDQSLPWRFCPKETWPWQKSHNKTFYRLLGIQICFVALGRLFHCEISFYQNFWCSRLCIKQKWSHNMSHDVFAFSVNRNRKTCHVAVGQNTCYNDLKKKKIKKVYQPDVMFLILIYTNWLLITQRLQFFLYLSGKDVFFFILLTAIIV